MDEPSVRSFELPWPPSGNHYRGLRTIFPPAAAICEQVYRNGAKKMMVWLRRNTHTRWYVKAEGELYHLEVRAAVGVQRPLTGACRIDAKFYPPDRRRRDMDNHFKMVLDALEKSKVVGDDSQFKAGSWAVMEPEKPGRVCVEITPLEDS